MMRTAMKIGAFVGLFVFLGLDVYNLMREKASLDLEVRQFEKEAQELREENKKLEADIGYLENPENLLKEFKMQFNYRLPGEHLIILVPESATSTATTSPSQ